MACMFTHTPGTVGAIKAHICAWGQGHTGVPRHLGCSLRASRVARRSPAVSSSAAGKAWLAGPAGQGGRGSWVSLVSGWFCLWPWFWPHPPQAVPTDLAAPASAVLHAQSGGSVKVRTMTVVSSTAGSAVWDQHPVLKGASPSGSEHGSGAPVPEHRKGLTLGEGLGTAPLHFPQSRARSSSLSSWFIGST